MSNALELREPKQWLAAQGRSQAELDVLRRFICADLKGNAPSDGELMFFMLYCQQHALDPFSKQAHLIQTKAGPQVCLGIDGMRIRAAQSGEYAGQDEPAFELDAKGAPVACRVIVYRLVAGQRCAFPGVAYMSESRGTSPIWSQRPRGMLAKCAEAQALRKAFPERCGAFYTTDELEHEGGPRAPAPAKATAANLNARLQKKSAPTVEAEYQDVDERAHVAAPVAAPVADPQDAQRQAAPSGREGAGDDASGLSRMVAAFRAIGVDLAAIADFLGKEPTEDLDEADVEKLRGWYKHLTEKDQA